MGDQRQGSRFENASAVPRKGKQLRNCGHCNPTIEASTGLSWDVGHGKSATYRPPTDHVVQPAIREPEDKNDQPDGEDAQPAVTPPIARRKSHWYARIFDKYARLVRELNITAE